MSESKILNLLEFHYKQKIKQNHDIKFLNNFRSFVLKSSKCIILYIQLYAKIYIALCDYLFTRCFT